MAYLGDAGLGQHLLGHGLVHAHCRTQDAGADVRHAGQLNRPCTVPSSPKGPWSSGNTTVSRSEQRLEVDGRSVGDEGVGGRARP